MIGVAPNGARKTKADHPGLPITAAELADCAADCAAKGASMIHLHVRDENGRHTLEAEAYRKASSAIRSAAGDRLVIQATTESAGMFGPSVQAALVRELHPEAVSLSIRELVPDAAAEVEAAGLFAWIANEKIWAQYILYTPEEVARFLVLQRRGVVPDRCSSVLLVLGRYTGGQAAAPRDLLPYLGALGEGVDWATCAFGQDEYACALTSIALGGGARVGFENCFHLANGRVAGSNGALVAELAQGMAAMGRAPLSAAGLRARYMT
jgi:uncharacterized protein (DUF849 family)